MPILNGHRQPLVLAQMSSVTTSSFRERVEAAAAAGFDGLGLSLPTYRQTLEAGTSGKEMRRILDDHGIGIPELEAVFGFAMPHEKTGVDFGGGLVYTTQEDLQTFWEMAELFEPHHLQAVGAFGTDQLEEDAAERFAALCDQAAQVGLTIALEFVPTTNIPDAGVALSIVEEAGRPNGGLCVDSWHHTRGANDLDLIRAVPSERVMLIQINDGPGQPVHEDFLHETLHYRLLPGDGDFDLDGFLSALLDNGASAPVSVEVLSDDLAAMDPHEATRRLVGSAGQVLPGS